MSVLAIQLPPRERLAARAAGHEVAAGLRPPAEWQWVLSQDGRSVAQAGRCAAALLPRADRVVLVLAEADVSWHRVTIPKAPPAKLRAALLGVMEETLLEDDEALHFALAPGALPGHEGWVAVTHRPWLAAALAELEAAGPTIERVLPTGMPGNAARGHFHMVQAGPHAAPWLALTDAEGARCVPLAGSLARALMPDAGQALRWTTTPAAATAAEHWLGAPVALLTESERVLEAVQGNANLRQFDLAARHRGTRALREAAAQWLSREWRPVRIGLAALLALNLVGLNVYAWRQQQTIAAKRVAMVDLLKSAHPGVRAVLDAPLQMERETERLRALAGRTGDGDLEALLGAAATAWPDGVAPVPMLRFEPGRLVLSTPPWGEAQGVQFRDRLRSAGYAAEQSEGRITVTRSPGRGAT